MFAFNLLIALKIKSGQRLEATGRPGNQYLIVNQLSFGFTTVLTIKPFDATCRVD
jgi:hypothetical protein